MMSNGSENSTTFNYDHPSNQVLAIVSGVIGFIGTVGNCFLICMILKSIKSRQPFEWLLLNMALLDLLFNMDYLFMQSVFIKYHESVGCRIAGLIDFICAEGSFLMPAAVAVNRYLSLYNRDQCEKIFTPRKVIVMCTFLWLVSFSIYFPYYITGNTGLDDLGICGVRLNVVGATVTSLPGIVLCYGVSIYCGYKIIRKLKEHKKQGGSMQTRLMDETKELTILVALLILIPLITQLPAVTIKYIQMFVLVDPWFSRMVTSIYPTTSACNPYLTIYTIKKYRLQVKRLCHNDVQPAVSTSNISTRTTSNIVVTCE